MNRFSEKSLKELGDCYVYGLADPRTKQFFYIGKGTGNRVFEHEDESSRFPESEKKKHIRIEEIRNAGLEVEKVIIKSDLTEAEAFAAEAAVINALRFTDRTGLTNIVAGHGSEEALTVEEYERIYGAEELSAADIKNKILVIKINKYYQRDMDPVDIYNGVRGIWRVSGKRVREVEYVFGVYHSLIVGVYKPTAWYTCKDAMDRLPRKDLVITSRNENRMFFVDEQFEQRISIDEMAAFYFGKSIAGLHVNHSAQNPVTYLEPDIQS